MSDWNTAIIQEFRDNQGVVGGMFEGRPLLLEYELTTARKVPVFRLARA